MSRVESKVYLTEAQANRVARDVVHETENTRLLIELATSAIRALMGQGEDDKVLRMLKRSGITAEFTVLTETHKAKHKKSVARAVGGYDPSLYGR